MTAGALLDRAGRAGLLLVGLLVLSPFLLRHSGFTLFLTTVLIWAIFALAFDLCFGLAGMMSFGHAAFFGVGAYTVAIVGQLTGWPFALLLACAMAVGLVHGLLVGLIGMRSSGVYFGLFTLGMAELVYVLFSTRLRPVTGGADGLSGLKQPALAWTGLAPDLAYYAMTSVIFVAVLLAVAVFRRSAYGRVLNAARLNEVRAAQLGFHVRRMRVVAFALSASGSALAGALLGTKMFYASPQLLQWSLSGDILMVAVIGGSGTLLGPVAGALVVETLRHFLSDQTIHWNGLLGAVFIAVTLFMPKGVVGQIPAVAAWLARRRQPRAHGPLASPATGGNRP
ncbi:branched-chain amino acid ABC transporter permease [Variovorax defluvii]|uniref:Branched-chain amino acid ABC transporter permease n=1 Tax=Variovorax defluvii TaxID=913761 RepID=A0ABP8HEZ8_9BURK